MVTVLEFITFPLPDPTKDFIMQFGENSRFAGVGARIPAGAWPAGERRSPPYPYLMQLTCTLTSMQHRQPSMAVFTFQKMPELPPGSNVWNVYRMEEGMLVDNCPHTDVFCCIVGTGHR
jgi:hypothetical protein